MASNSPRVLLASLTSFVLLFAAFFGPAGAARAAAPQGTYFEFRDRFDKAISLNAKDEMKRLFSGHEAFAINLVMDTCALIQADPSERVMTRMEGIKTAWAAAKDTEFVKHMERYFSYLDTAIAREREKIKAAYDKASREFATADAAKDKSKLNGLAEEFEALAKAFEEAGDKYFAGNAWLYRALCFEERFHGADTKFRLVAQAYRRLVDLRLEIDLKDGFYRETLPNLTKLEALGFGELKEGPAGGEGGAAAGPVLKGAGTTLTLPTTFSAIEDVEGPPRPVYNLDEHHSLWNPLYFAAVGSTAQLSRLEKSPVFKRSGSSKIEMDLDGDGTFDRDLPVRGNLELVEFELGEGASKRKWAMLAKAGNETDQYQSVLLSNAASDQNWSIFVAPGASVTADVAGTTLQVFDDNMDGVYGSWPATYGHTGMPDGLFQPELDSILVGESKRAIPWSEYVRFPSGWMKLESQNGGTSILATPTEVRTGKLKLVAKGLTPAYLVVQGLSDFEHSYFDLAGAKEVEVPVGRYKLFWGLVTKGSKKQLMKALVLPGSGSPIYEVLDGKTVEVAFGAPFNYTCEYEKGDEKITIAGKSVTLIGAGGERYERVYGAVPRPEVSYRKVGTKRGSKPEEMPIIQDRDGFDRRGGYAAMWKPLDLVMEKNSHETEIEVQLTEKKNKLFGKIEGTWH